MEGLTKGSTKGPAEGRTAVPTKEPHEEPEEKRGSVRRKRHVDETAAMRYRHCPSDESHEGRVIATRDAAKTLLQRENKLASRLTGRLVSSSRPCDSEEKGSSLRPLDSCRTIPMGK